MSGARAVRGGAFPMFTRGVLRSHAVLCLVMGVLIVLLLHKGGMKLAPFLMTGILGGFTTFSAFSQDALTLYERGQAGLALTYVVASVLLSLLAIVAGVTLMRGLGQ